MVIIRFPYEPTERRGLGFLARRFSGKSWVTGEVMVEGPATYERIAPLRDTPANCGSMRPGSAKLTSG